MADVLRRNHRSEVQLNLGRIWGEFWRDDTCEISAWIDGRTRAGSRQGFCDRGAVETLAIPAAERPPLTWAPTSFQRGVSDHIRGRGLSRPKGHLGWSLTPRDCCWRQLRQRRHQASGTERRPRTTGCNLHDDQQLPDPLTARESQLVDPDLSRDVGNPGGTPRARVLFPYCVPPLEALIEQRSLSTHTAVANESDGISGV